MSVAARLNKKKQEVNDRFAGRQNTYRFKLAETEVRLLPSWRPADHEDPTFFHDFGLTWVKSFDNDVLATVGDRKITFGEEDEVRNLVYKALNNAKTDAQRKHYKEMLASPRVLVGGLVLNDPDVKPDEPQILEFSEAQFTGPITDLLVDAEKAGDDVLSLEHGFNLSVKKSGKGFDTKYGFTLARKSTKVDPAVMKNVHDIDAFIRAKFADGEKARNAIKSLTQGEPLALVDRSSDLTGDRQITSSYVDDGDYNIVDQAGNGEPVTEVEHVNVSDAEIDALFD